MFKICILFQYLFARKHINSGRTYLAIIGFVALPLAPCTGQLLQFFHRLSPNEGLSQGSNEFVFRDTRGFVWLSSIDGLNRFDGQSVKTYKADGHNGLLSNFIAGNFFEDAASDLWFATYEGIQCYRRQKDRFESFVLKNRKGKPVKQDYFAFHLDPQGGLWVRTGLGEVGLLHRFDTRNGRDSLMGALDGQRHQVVLDGQGRAASVASFFNSQKGIEVVDLRRPGTKTTFFATDKPGLPPATVFSLWQAEANEWWVGLENGLALLNPKNDQVLHFGEYEGNPIGEVWAVSPLPDSLLLISASKGGLLLFDLRRRHFFRRLPRNFGAPTAQWLYLDPQENLWLSNARGGPHFVNLHKQKFEKIAAMQGAPVTALFQARDGSVWCNGKGGKVLRFTGHETICDTFEVEKQGKKTLKGRIQYFFEDEQGAFWACHKGELYQWQAARGVFLWIQNLPNDVLYIGHLPQAGLIVSTFSGVFALQRSGVGFKITPLEALGPFQQESATAFHEDRKGRLYLALDAKRLVVLEKKEGLYKQAATLDDIGYTHSFYETGDTLWIASTTGILRLNTTNLNWIRLTEQEHGAPSEYYYGILPDGKRRFWLSCNQGILCYDPVQKTCRRYTSADGLQDNEFNRNAFLRLPDGTILMGGNEGLNRFHPDSIRDVTQLPSVQITRLLVNDEPFETATQIGELRQLPLNYSQNTASFHFVALEYSDPAHNRLRYRLDPYDKDWLETGNPGFARYANLPPGSYVLQVKAANSDGVWNETPTTFALSVLPPWWRTWWFYVLCVVSLSALVYGIFTYRLQQALKIERMRIKISSDLHDDVGTILSGLAMQSEMLELRASEADKPKLKRIAELSRWAMSHLRDAVWAIDARKDKLENLFDRMREYAEETLAPKGIHFKIETENLSLKQNLPVNVRQNLYLIYKEAVTNAAKHSNGDQVSIRLQKNAEGNLEMRICDNGTAAEKTWKTTGSGLSNMQMRAEQIGGRLTVSREQGYCVVLKLG